MSESSLTRYPPFWVYLFSVAALIGLVLVQPKLESRQRAIEGAAIKREAVASGNPAEAAVADEAPPRIPFWPLYVLLTFGAVGGGALSFAHYFRMRAAEAGTRVDSPDPNKVAERPCATVSASADAGTDPPTAELGSRGGAGGASGTPQES